MTRVVTLLIAAAIVTGCSGDDTGSATTTDVSAESQPTTAAPSSAPSSAPTTTAPTTSTTSPTINSTTASTAPPVEVPDGAGTATGALDDADVQIETDAGTIQIGVAEVPDGVSDTFPIPADLDVQLSSSTGTDFGFSGVSAMTIAELAAFYDTELTGAGYTITERQEIVDVLAVYSFERDGESGQVAISSAPGGAGSSVLVTIGDGSDRTEDAAGG